MEKESEQMSAQEKAVVFATCAELEGIISGISQKHNLKVIPAFLWDELIDTLKQTKEYVNQLEEEIKTLEHNLGVYDRVLGETKQAFSDTEPGRLLVGDQDIIIPGVNGPRPEHMHLDRDSMTSVLRAQQAKMQSKQHPQRHHPKGRK